MDEGPAAAAAVADGSTSVRQSKAPLMGERDSAVSWAARSTFAPNHHNRPPSLAPSSAELQKHHSAGSARSGDRTGARIGHLAEGARGGEPPVLAPSMSTSFAGGAGGTRGADAHFFSGGLEGETTMNALGSPSLRGGSQELRALLAKAQQPTPPWYVQLTNDSRALAVTTFVVSFVLLSMLRPQFVMSAAATPRAPRATPTGASPSERAPARDAVPAQQFSVLKTFAWSAGAALIVWVAPHVMGPVPSSTQTLSKATAQAGAP